MQIYDIVIADNMPFEDYLKLPGMSYSGIKAAERGTRIDVTAKMIFGSLVDAYLFEPAKYNGEQYERVRPVAVIAQKYLGAALRYGRRQLAVTCTMQHKGFHMRYKGRVDLFIGHNVGVVVDYKVSDMPLVAAINHFGYNHQVNGYAIPLMAKTSIIFSTSPKAPYTAQMQPVANSLDFWQAVTVKYGIAA